MAILCAHFYPLLKFREHSSEVWKIMVELCQSCVRSRRKIRGYCCDHFGFLPVWEDGKENALDSSPEICVMPSLTPSRTHTHTFVLQRKSCQKISTLQRNSTKKAAYHHIEKLEPANVWHFDSHSHLWAGFSCILAKPKSLNRAYRKTLFVAAKSRCQKVVCLSWQHHDKHPPPSGDTPRAR